MKDKMKVQFADWTIEIGVDEKNDLNLVVDHPVNGHQRQVEINIDRHLGVIHDSHWTIDDRLEQEAMLQERAVRALSSEPRLAEVLVSASKDAMFAQDILHRLQGYRYEWNVPFGQVSRWERNGVVCNAPKPVHHALAYRVIEELVMRALGKVESD